MKYLSAKFKNYIGFYNGMGLYEICIDFSKCTHSIVLITGANGCGKSTLMNHLNIFPDPSSDFIPEKTAQKELVLMNDNDIYNIQIISPADMKGRKTTKAYIQKNGLELNENGNISSYKDIIFSEFELDSNYLSLSRLSSVDRGLGDKTPAERKKFVSNIIDNLEIYNSMYKTLNKKSLIYKSHVNTLHTKIQNIGNKEGLEQRLASLQSREVELNNKIIANNNTIVSIQAKNSIDQDEAKEIQELTDTKNSLESGIAECNASINMNYHNTKIKKEDIVEKYNHDLELLNITTNKLNDITDNWKEKSNRLREVSNQLLTLESDLSSININDTISNEYSECKDKIKSIYDELAKLNIPADINLILPISELISFCDKFIALIDHFNDGLQPNDIEFLINTYSREYIANLMTEQGSITLEIEKHKEDLSKIQNKISILAILDNRPDKCKIDSCPFISEALSLKKNIKVDPIDELSDLQTKILRLSDTLTKNQEIIDYSNSMMSKKMELDVIRRTISEYEGGISIFYPELLNNLNELLININPFNNIRDHSNLTDGLNLLKILDEESKREQILKAKYETFKEKVQLYNSSKVVLENLNKEQEELNKSIIELKNQMNIHQETINGINSMIKTEEIYSNIYTACLNLNKELDQVNAKLDKYNQKSSKAMEAVSLINELNEEINIINMDIAPIKNEISAISGQLVLLNSYYEEYDKYKQSYDTIETIKKYCSPTGGGIQTLFMQIYMSKTKELANDILSMLFGGSYQLLDFIINESEFRIPFVGEGLPVDDISSGSSSQVAMMSLIINLVLLHQASTKFNIAELDEVTANLDAHVNSQFTNVLFHSMHILNIEQLFLISHSTEIDNTFADVIKFKGYDDYESSITSGNIIWDYDEIIK